MKNLYNSFKKQMIEYDANFHLLKGDVIGDLYKWATKMHNHGFYDLYGWSMFLICNALLSNRLTDRCTPYMDELKAVAQKHQGYPEIYFLILQGAISFYFHSDIDKGIDYGERALHLFKECNYEDQLVLYHILQQLFTVYMSKGEIILAYKYASLALNCKLNKAFISRKAATYSWLGDLESKYTNNISAAIFNYLKAAEIHKKYDNHAFYSTTLNRLSKVYIKQQKYTEAYQTITDAIKISKEVKFHSMTISFHITLGEIYKYLGEYENAKACFQLVLESEHIIDQSAIANTHRELGLMFTDIENYDKAYEHYQEALDFYTSKGIHSEQVYITLNIASMYLKQENYVKTKEYLDISQDIKFNDMKAKCAYFEICYLYYKKIADYKKALDFMEKYIHTRDQIDLEIDQIKMELSKVKFELNKV